MSNYKLVLASKEGAPFKSYKLTVDLPDKSILMSEGVWPERICIQTYRERVVRNHQSNN